MDIGGALRRWRALLRISSRAPAGRATRWETDPPPLDEYDTAAEVDATFRTQRRIAIGYFLVFLVVTIGVPALTLVLDWWSSGRVIGGMSPNFAMAAVGLYVFFFALALAAARLATAVEDRMLGGPDASPFADEERPL
ncbi:MAG TPA: hypothetical protein VML96_08845 [Egibacteraceae bacterium]|nr:hypothetical protein [Egibacteraceae bacterium]